MNLLENMDIDTIQKEMRKFRFSQNQLDYFKEQEFDGIVIDNLDEIPDFPDKTVGAIVKFKAFMKKIAGKEYLENEGKFTGKSKGNCENETQTQSNNLEVNKIFPEFGLNFDQHVNEIMMNNLNQQNNSKKSNSINDEHTHSLLTPTFSEKLENELKKDKITKTTLFAMINETVNFYRNLNIRFDSKTQYKNLSDILIKKYTSVYKILEKEVIYPSNDIELEKIKDKLVNTLSQRISKKTRNTRYWSKVMNVKTESSPKNNHILDQIPIVDKILKKEVLSDYHYQILHIEMKEKFNDKSFQLQLNQMLSETFEIRRIKLKDSNLNLNEKINEYCYLKHEENLLNEFGMILGYDDFEQKIHQLFNIFEEELIFDNFDKQLPHQNHGSRLHLRQKNKKLDVLEKKNNEQVLKVFVEVEMKINSKYKKNEWKPVFVVFDTIDNIDFKNNKIQSPRVFVVKDGYSIVKYLIVNSEEVLYEIQKEKSIFRVLAILFSFYFVFNIEYDSKLENMMMFFDKILINSRRTESNKKTLTYLKYLNLVKEQYDSL